MLAIRCGFLQGTYQAAAPGRPTEPEWPPHPARLHAAMVASARSMGADEMPSDLLAALRWLEGLAPPILTVPRKAGSRRLVSVYVPRNLTPQEVSGVRGHLRRGKSDAARRDMGRVDRVFPTRVPGEEPVYFVWPDATPESTVLAALDRVVGGVQYLGSSRSPVCCALVDDPPPPNYVPAQDTGSEALRVAGPGMTDALGASDPGVVGMLPRRVVSYGRPTPTPREVIEGPFGRLLILERQDGFALSVLHAILLTKALRRAVLARAGDDSPSLLHGHGRHPHVAFLALANVGHEHSTGEVRGLAVAIPRDASADEEAAVARATELVTEIAIHKSISPWKLARRAADQDLRTLDPGRWIGPSARWRTVTPIVLDRHPKRARGETVEEMIGDCFRNAHLPSPSYVHVSRQPFVPGAVSAAMHTGHGTPRGLSLHAEVEFERPVRGPVVAGRGRYFGIGLLKPHHPRRDGS